MTSIDYLVMTRSRDGTPKILGPDHWVVRGADSLSGPLAEVGNRPHAAENCVESVDLAL